MKRRASSSPPATRKHRTARASYSPVSDSSSSDLDRDKSLDRSSEYHTSTSPGSGCSGSSSESLIPGDVIGPSTELAAPVPASTRVSTFLATQQVATGGLNVPPLASELNLPNTMEAFRLNTPRSREPSHDETIIFPRSKEIINCGTTGALIPYNGPDRFPVFTKGNVIIRTGQGISPSEYRLHNTVLSRHSPWFANLLQRVDTVNPNPTWFLFKLEVKNGKATLVSQHALGSIPEIRPSGNEACYASTLNRIEPLRNDSASPRVPFQASPVLEISEGQAAVALYGQVLGAFYNNPPEIPKSDVETTLDYAERIVKIASELGCMHLIRQYLTTALAQYRQALFIAIKDDPARWLRLATSIEDKSIYTESLVHIVGAHPFWPWPTKRAVLHEDILQLVRKKSGELVKTCIEIDRELFLLNIYGHEKSPLGLTPTSNVETWVLIQMFRDTIARELESLDNDRKSSLRKGIFYRKIHGEDYLDYESTKSIGQGLVGGRWESLGKELKELKRDAAQVVEEVAKNELMIDPAAHGIEYLTCTKISEEDIPWRSLA